MMSARAALGPVAVGLVAVAFASCRDAPPLFDPGPHRPPVVWAGPWRLTYSGLDNRLPAWSATGNTILYAAEGFDHLPRIPGVLVQIPYEGGPALSIFPEIQDNVLNPPWLTGPAVSSATGQVAYVEMWNVFPSPVCGGTLTCDLDNTAPLPMVGVVMVRLRSQGDVHPRELDPSVRVDFEGRPRLLDEDPPYDIHAFPFQRLFAEQSEDFFRPSWSPDGARLVLSDGTQLIIWDTGTNTTTPIAGTDNGVWPAWSPTGEWIAYTRLVSEDPIVASCTCTTGLVQYSERHFTYPISDRRLTIVRPDGSELRDIASGSEPAWAPDGDAIYFRRDDRIWRVPLGSGEPVPVPVPGTTNGMQPAVSGDGRHLAFIVPDTLGVRNLWVVPLNF